MPGPQLPPQQHAQPGKGSGGKSAWGPHPSLSPQRSPVPGTPVVTPWQPSNKAAAATSPPPRTRSLADWVAAKSAAFSGAPPAGPAAGADAAAEQKKAEIRVLLGKYDGLIAGLQPFAESDPAVAEVLSARLAQREQLVSQLRDLKPLQVQIQQAVSEKERACSRVLALTAELAELRRLEGVKMSEVREAEQAAAAKSAVLQKLFSMQVSEQCQHFSLAGQGMAVDGQATAVPTPAQWAASLTPAQWAEGFSSCLPAGLSSCFGEWMRAMAVPSPGPVGGDAEAAHSPKSGSPGTEAGGEELDEETASRDAYMGQLASAMVAGQHVPQLDAVTLAHLQYLEPQQIDLTGIAAGVGGSLAPYRRIVTSSRGDARVCPLVGVKKEGAASSEAAADGAAPAVVPAAVQQPFQQAMSEGSSA